MSRKCVNHICIILEDYKLFKQVVACILVFSIIASYAPAAAVGIPDDAEQSLRISDEFEAANPNGAFTLKSVAVETHEDSGRIVTEVIRQGGTSGKIDVTLKVIDISAKIGLDYSLKVPQLIFSRAVEGDDDKPLLDGAETYDVEAVTAAAPQEEKPEAVKTGLRAAKEQATGAESDRDKFTYTDDEKSELLNTAATAAGDYYTQAPGTEFTLSFGAGERVKSFYIDIINDDIPEAEEQFIFVITSVTGGGSVGLQKGHNRQHHR